MSDFNFLEYKGFSITYDKLTESYWIHSYSNYFKTFHEACNFIDNYMIPRKENIYDSI